MKYLMILLLMTRCGVAEPEEKEVPVIAQVTIQEDGSKAMMVQVYEELPYCSEDNRGSLYYIANDSQFVVCGGVNGWIDIDLRGKDGKDAEVDAEAEIRTMQSCYKNFNHPADTSPFMTGLLLFSYKAVRSGRTMTIHFDIGSEGWNQLAISETYDYQQAGFDSQSSGMLYFASYVIHAYLNDAGLIVVEYTDGIIPWTPWVVMGPEDCTIMEF